MNVARNRGAAPLAVIATVVVAVLALYLIATAIAELKVSSTREGWRQTIGYEDVRERHFVEGPNAAALDLEELVAGIGINLVPRGDEARPRQRSVGEAGDRFQKIKAELQHYGYGQLQRPDAVVDAAPERVASWLEENAEALAAIRARLQDVPRWGLEIPEHAWATPLPNLLGQIHLQKVLMGDALAAIATNDHQRAVDNLAASWNLSGSIRDDPILISQLIALSATRMQVGLLRKMAEPPLEWVDRLSSIDPRSSFVDALHLEGWAWSQAGAAEWTGNHPVRDFFIRHAKPYARFCVADLSDDYRRTLAQVDFSGPLCEAGVDGSRIDLRVSVPEWNLLGDSVVPHLNGALGRLARLELDIELTRHVLTKRTRSDPGKTAWPSVACPDSTWLLAVGDDGIYEIALDRDKSWPEQKGVVLANRHVQRDSVTP